MKKNENQIPLLISKVNGLKEATVVAELAKEIWQQHFTPIIGASQVSYMLEKFQSPTAIAAQMSSAADYYLANLSGKQVGYLALIPQVSEGRMMISKIYVKKEARGTGIGRRLLQFTEVKCRRRHLDFIWLTVNRRNDGAIKWYRRNGFSVTDEVKKEIGGGFFMDDYIMTKAL